jgi:uncharacterized protein (TIGR00369 family)
MRAIDAESLARLTPFAATVGVVFQRLDPAEVTGQLEWRPQLCTVGGVMHGGALMTLADAVAGVCAYLNLPPGASTATVGLSVEFLRPVRGGVVQASARPVQVGGSSIVVQTELRHAGGERICQVTQTQAVRR